MEILEKETIIVSFSGGRTSAYMSWWLKTYMNHLYDFVFIYANTGQEHPKTLDFVNNVDQYLGLNLIWVEALVNPEDKKGTTHKVVDFKTADRVGNVFEDVIRKYGLPNKAYLHCTRELKLKPIHHWIKENGYKGCRQALGIRYDEYRRVKNDKDYIYPLANIIQATKEDVLEFWAKQPFDLDLPEHFGNCLTCYKKSEKKLWMVAQEMPEAFDFFKKMENLYAGVKAPKGDRVIFRHNRTTQNVLDNNGYPEGHKMTEIDHCGEECGVITLKEFKEKEKIVG